MIPLRGVRLGIDVGSVRVGVARSDPHGILASPVATLRRDPSGQDLDDLVGMVVDSEVVEVIVGLPKTLRGTDGSAVLAAREYAAALTRRLTAQDLEVPINFVDERLTSVSANRMLADRGIDSRARRSVVDQAAAVTILQSWLDGARR